MKDKYVITISHLLGSGGAYIGKKLSESLGIPFIDRQILKAVANKLNVPEDDIEDREERLSSFWESFMAAESVSNPINLMNTQYFLPSDKELFDLESEYIETIADNGSAIILGRSGRYILRDHKRHLSVFVTADMDDRVENVKKLYNISKDAAKIMISKNDKARDNYIKSFTHFKWLDARSYDICINTSSIGLDNAVEIVKKSVDYKLK
jgi:cytidylate kinase